MKVVLSSYCGQYELDYQRIYILPMPGFTALNFIANFAVLPFYLSPVNL